MRIRLLLAFVAALALGASAAAFASGAVFAGLISAATLIPTAAASWAEAKRRVEPGVVSRLQREVSHGKRLALYDHETGLLAQWYLTMRFAEECDRARRYGRPLSVLLLQAGRGAEEAEYMLLDWMRMHRRSTDLVGCLSAGQYVVLLPDTDAAGAELALERLQADINIPGAIAGFPQDGASPEELQAALALRLGIRSGQLAA